MRRLLFGTLPKVSTTQLREVWDLKSGETLFGTEPLTSSARRLTWPSALSFRSGTDLAGCRWEYAHHAFSQLSREQRSNV